jgi:hypothetical protein
VDKLSFEILINWKITQTYFASLAGFLSNHRLIKSYFLQSDM